MTRKSFEIPGLEVFDPESFDAKLRRFGSEGLRRMHGVFDFDFTLTTPAANGRPVSSWGIVEEHLPPEAQAKAHAMFDHYYPLELNGLMTVEDAETWWNDALTLQRDNSVNLLEVEKHFVNAATIRHGSKETLDFLKQLDVPTVIISAGVKNVIDMWCATYDVNPDLIISTVFETDEDGRMTGWDESTVVHTFNKAETGHPELERLKQDRPNVLVVGDNINDADMATGDETVIRVRIVDTRPDSTHDYDSIRRSTAERFDALIEDGDMMPVRALIDRIDAYADAS